MFKRLKDKIEEKRNSTNLLWKISVRTKDFVWRLFYVVIRKKENPEKTFGNIYKNKLWGKKGDFFSGIGSLPKNTLRYRKYLKNFLERKKIKKVIDLGCGDFRIGKDINWNGRGYTGIDIVEPLIKRNNKLYSKKNIRFMKKNIVRDYLPDAELCIIREVLQHLPNKDVLKILKKIRKFKYVLITEGVKSGNFKVNEDIKTGEYRLGGLNLESPPFNQKFKKVLEYNKKDSEVVLRTILIENEK